MIIPLRKFKFQQLSTTTNTFNKFLIKDGFFTKNKKNLFLQRKTLLTLSRNIFLFTPNFNKSNFSLFLFRFYFKKLKYKKFTPNVFKLNKLD
jgi:hypothetical protein